MTKNIDEMNLTDLLGYAYSAAHRIENSYILSNGFENKFRKCFSPKDLNKFIINFQRIMTKLDCLDFNNDIEKSLKKFNETDVSIYESIDYVLTFKYLDIKDTEQNVYYDLSLLN